MASTRDQIIEAACGLLDLQGYHATGLNQIVKESGAPKGSLYYYFPDGKDGLMAEAIERTGRAITERIDGVITALAEPGAAVRQFVEFIAESVEASQFRTGCPLTAVAMETATTNERLNLECRAAYQKIQQAFAEKLLARGFSETRATSLATLITANIEGGVILSRTYHSSEPLRLVARELEAVINAATQA